MRVCVTGSTGYVGRAVVRHLLNAGVDVHAVTRKAADQNTEGRLRYFSGPVLDPEHLKKAMMGCDAVVHLVGGRRRELKRAGLSYEDVDVKSVAVAVEAMRALSLRRMVLLSAAAIGRSHYVKSKAKAEKLLQQTDLDWTIFRPAAIIGPGETWPRILSPVILAASKLPGAIGNVAKHAQNISRDQLAEAIVRSLVSEHSIGKILSVPEIIELVC